MRLRRSISIGVLAVVALAAYIERSIYLEVRREAARDFARPAGAIVVMGAAEYAGEPSPVLEARLDHAFDLEERGLAPLVVTTGGPGGDRHFTEAGVGRDYLIQRGMAAAKILTESRGETSYESVRAVTRILGARHILNCIVVSDGFHICRVRTLFAAAGIQAWGSPVPNSSIEADPFLRTVYSLRETLILSLWHLGYRG